VRSARKNSGGGPTGRPFYFLKVTRCRRLSALIVVLLLCLGRTLAAEATNANLIGPGPIAYDRTADYQARQIQGWRVLVNKKLLAETNLCEPTMKRLEAQLAQITRVMQAGPLRQLREIPVWVERSSRQFPCMCYHESYEWLRTHGVNPDKTGGVELANPDKFLTWTKEQPWMVLHELAHGYHQRFLGENHPGLRQCYEQAKASGKYDSVLRYNGNHERHYALNNVKEYFAEATEAFFGRNDFQPFTRAELKEFDPEMFELLRKVWEVAD
jgi:hypothetical protein